MSPLSPTNPFEENGAASNPFTSDEEGDGSKHGKDQKSGGAKDQSDKAQVWLGYIYWTVLTVGAISLANCF